MYKQNRLDHYSLITELFLAISYIIYKLSILFTQSFGTKRYVNAYHDCIFNYFSGGNEAVRISSLTNVKANNLSQSL